MISTSILYPWLPDTAYEYGVWDCFKLATFIREYHNLKPYPVSEYPFDNEDSQPQNFIFSEMLKYLDTNIHSFENFDVVCISANNYQVLGTILDNHIIYMSDKARLLPLTSSLVHCIILVGRVK